MNQTNFQNLLNPSWTAGNLMKTNKTGYRKNMVAFVGSAFVAVVLSAALLLAGCSGVDGGGISGLTDADSVATDKAALAIVYAGTDSETDVTGNITLPLTGDNGTTITWSSDNQTVIAGNGTVTPLDTNTTVVLTATITKGSVTDTKTFSLMVIGTLGENVPKAPINLVVSPGGDDAYLAWSAGGDGTESVITQYTVYYSTSDLNGLSLNEVKSQSTAKNVLMEKGASLTIWITPLEVSTEYFFVVTASNDEGESGPSVSVEATPATGLTANISPNMVPDVEVTQGNTVLTVTWTTPGFTGYVNDDGTAGTITHYTLYYSPEPISNLWGADVESVTIDDATKKNHTVTGLENGKDYYFVVTARNAFAESRGLALLDTTGGVVGTPVVANRVPGVPANVSSSPGDGHVLVNWSAPADLGIINGDGTVGTITAYTVYYSLHDDFTDLSATAVTSVDAGTDFSQKIENLTNGTLYYFAVSASNATGSSTGLISVSATPAGDAKPNAFPSAPTISTVVAGQGKATITWTAPTILGTINGDGTEGVITGYTVYYSKTFPFTAAGAEAHVTAEATATTVDVTGLAGGELYYFIMTATTDAGEGPASSGEISVTTELTDADSVAADKATLAIGYAGTDSETGVTGNITLPLTGANGTTITWSSDNQAVITDDGTVTRPDVNGANTTDVIMTATIKKGDETDTRGFTLTVLRVEGTSDIQSVAADKATLAIGYAGTDSETGVTGNITLPLTGANGTIITWSSDNQAVITDDGTVTRPDVNGANTTDVIMTATIKKGDETDTRGFTLTVIAKVGNAVPDAPIDLVVSPGDMMGDGLASTATLAWSAGGTGFINGDGTEGVITKYTVYYSTSNLADLSLSEVKSEVEKKNVFMEDAPMEKGAPHGLRIYSLDINKELFFVVTASNAEGESLPSVSVRIITNNLLQGNLPPDLVPDVKVAPGDATLTVTWTAPGNTGSVDDGGTEGTITHYTVYYSPEKISNLWGANVKSVTIDDPALKTYTVTGLENGNDYYFVVTASNAFAEGRGLISIDTTGGVVGTPGS